MDSEELSSNDLSDSIVNLAMFDGENRWLHWWPGIRAKRLKLEEEVIEEMESFLDLMFNEDGV